MKRLLIALIALGFAAPVGAQTVSGIVTRGGIPVDGAIVLLTDASGREVARTVAREGGQYTVRTQPGSWFVRIIQIGWRPMIIGPHDVRGHTTVNVALTSPQVALSAITVRGESRCAVRPDSSVAAFAVWEAARSGLLATALTRTEPYDVRITSSERSLAPDGVAVTADSTTTLEGRSLTPFRSLPAAVLADSGFLTSDTSGVRRLWAPDAEVLLSEEFVATHCLQAQARDSTLIGVRFEPARKRRNIVDVEGVLWVDRRSAELRTLEYSYVNGPDILTRAQAGGTVDFKRIPRGRWVVSRWSIRQPIIRERTEGQGNIVPGSRSAARTREELAGIQITSGSLLGVSRDGVRLWEPGKVSFVARVVDSATGAPRARVLTGFANSGDRTATDSAGRVRFLMIEPGAHVLRFDDPALASVGMAPPMRQVIVPEFNDAEIEVRLPSARDYVVATCGARAVAWGDGLLYGKVTRRAAADSSTSVIVVTNTPFHQLGGGVIDIENVLEVRPFPDGSFKVCGIPRDAALRVRRSTDPGLGVPVRFPAGAVAATVAIP